VIFLQHHVPPGLLVTPPTPSVDDPLGTPIGPAADATGGDTENRYIVTNLNPTGTGSLHNALVSEEDLYITFLRGMVGTINHGAPQKPKPNKTVDGRGADITLGGAGLQVWGTDHPGETSNLIVAYVTLRAAGLVEAADNFSISQGADLVWLDHITTADAFDGLLDVTLFSDDPGHVTRVTVSNSWIGPNPGPESIAIGALDGKAMLIGMTAAYDGDFSDVRLQVLVHDSVFDGNRDRNPSVFSGAQVHVFNSVIKRWGATDGSGSVGMQAFGYAQLRSEANIFQPYNDGDTHVNGELVTAADKEGFKATGTGTTNGVANSNTIAADIDSLHLNGSTVDDHRAGEIFTPDYPYTAAEATTGLRDSLLATAGNVQ
jgi:pectate lyase